MTMTDTGATTAPAGRSTHPGARPMLSVVMPTHNTERWVAETLESLLSQGDLGLEIIAVDDCSTDSTWDIVTDYAARDARVRPMRSPGTGSSAARNAGVAAATGRYLAFADSDDIVAPGAYEALVGSLEASGSDVALGEHRVFTDDLADAVRFTAPLPDATYASLEDAPDLIHRVPLWDTVYRREAWNRQGIHARPAIRANDLVPKSTALLGARGIDTVGRTVYYYRSGGGANVMTRRVATAAGLRSHFVEHIERARLIALLGSPRILDAAASAYVNVDGFIHLTDFAATGSPSRTEARELRGLARDTLSAYGVHLARGAATRHGLRKLDKLAVWGAAVHTPWPAGLAPARARRAAKAAVVAAGTRLSRRRP